MRRCRNKLRRPSLTDGNRRGMSAILRSQLVVVIAAIVIATPVSAATGTAGDTCVRHGCQRSTNSGLRGTDAEHYSILSGTEQHHQASQYYQPQHFTHRGHPSLSKPLTATCAKYC